MGRRKKKVVITIDPGLQEFGGWKLGDIVWGIRPNKDVFRGEIIQFIESEDLAQVLCSEGGGYLICEMSTLVENSTKSEMKKKAKEYIVERQNKK
jgi:hypothetical protein